MGTAAISGMTAMGPGETDSSRGRTRKKGRVGDCQNWEEKPEK
jgi:hypothetical protein